MAVVVKFYGRQFLESFDKATITGILRAGEYYKTACQRAVSIPNTGVRVRRKRNTGRGKRGSSFTVYPRPSKPGEPPRLRTGFGRKNIVRQFSGFAAGRDAWVRVGVTKNAIYMFFLEVGTRTIARRPWMLYTLFRFRAQIAALAMRRTSDK